MPVTPPGALTDIDKAVQAVKESKARAKQVRAKPAKESEPAKTEVEAKAATTTPLKVFRGEDINESPVLPRIETGDLIVNAATLTQALRQVAGVVNNTSSLPILTQTRITVDGDKITLMGTDLDTFIEVNLKALHGASKLKIDCCVDVKRMIHAVSESQISYLKEKLVVFGSDNAKVWFGVKREITLLTMESKDFPPTPDLSKNAKLTKGTFRDPAKFAKALTPAASEDESRYILQGVFVTPEALAATDGRRLHTVGAENCSAKLVMEKVGKDGGGIIMPTAMFERIGSFGDTVDFEVFGRKVAKAKKGDPKDLNTLVGAVQVRVKNRFTPSVEESSITMTSKLIDGIYPNYKQVIPHEAAQTHEVNAEAVLRHLRKTDVVEGDASLVKLTIETNRLTISVNNPDIGKADHLELPVKDGTPMAMTLNSRYLADAVGSAQTEIVRLGFVDALTPIVVEGSDSWLRGVVMPCRNS